MVCLRTTFAGLGLIVASGCGPSRQALIEELDETRKQLHGVQAELATETRTHESLEDQLETFGDEAAMQRRRVVELEQELSVKGAALDAVTADREAELEVYNQLAFALLALIDAGTIELEPRKGKMMIKIQEAVLFPSGRASLTKQGKETLVQVTQALVSLPEREFQVVGHTDNVPIRSSRYVDNLDLSLDRASNVVRFMVQKGFPRHRLSPAGYGDNDPLESNDTEEGRAKNRRIDIMLMPDLSKLPALPSMPTP